MNDAGKILQAIEGLTQKIDQQGKAIKVMQEDVSDLKDSLAYTNTAIKALPTKKDAEEIVETAVDAAKSELRADILRLDAKIVRKSPASSAGLPTLRNTKGLKTRRNTDLHILHPH